jgi:hypothetical protein
MALSDEQEALFIELWREKPCLYDVSCKSYSNKNEKRKATEEIAEKMSISADSVTKELVSLRTQYARLIKALPSGSNCVAKTSHQKCLVEKLDFLKQHVRKRDSTSNIAVCTQVYIVH